MKKQIWTKPCRGTNCIWNDVVQRGCVKAEKKNETF